MKKAPLLLFLATVAQVANAQVFRLNNESKEFAVKVPGQIITVKFRLDEYRISSTVGMTVEAAYSSSALVNYEYIFIVPENSEKERAQPGPISLTYPKDSSFQIKVTDTMPREINLSIKVKQDSGYWTFNETIKINTKKTSTAAVNAPKEPSKSTKEYRFQAERDDIPVYGTENGKELKKLDIEMPLLLGKADTGIEVRITTINLKGPNEEYYALDVKAKDFTSREKRIYLNNDSTSQRYILLSDVFKMISLDYGDGKGARRDPITRVFIVWVPDN